MKRAEKANRFGKLEKKKLLQKRYAFPCWKQENTRALPTGFRLMVFLNFRLLAGNPLHMRSEKNERPKNIGLSHSLTERFNEYISTSSSPTDQGALFTPEIRCLNYGWARNLVKKIGTKAGVSRFHAHAARHWYATALLRRDSHEAGIDIREIQIHTGHASLASTQAYTHLTGREVAKHSSEMMVKYF